ncbi:hypothetical protein B0H10DRAFT_1957482 [Mycena sp. CBHHK59/15]|nr:hypothetical protein B0H10DRAFT_1957482 [Mycena sp. CBHHK59/15]
MSMLLLSRCEFCVHVGYAARKGVSYTHHSDESSVLDVGARCRDPADSLRRRDGRGQVVVVVEGKGRTIFSPDELSQKIIGSNELSLNAIKVTRFRENKRSNEVTKKATTQIPEFATFLFSGGGRDGEGEGEDGGGPTEDKAKGVRAGQAVT